MPRVQGAQGATGTPGSTGLQGPSGATPVATLTVAYVVASGATVLTVSDTSDLLVGSYAQVTDGTNVLSGKITAKSSGTSLTFTPLASRPTGEPANAYSFAIGSLLTVGGAQGPQGIQGTAGSAGTNGTNGVPVSTTTTSALTVTTSSMTIAVVDSTGFQVGQQLFVGDGTTVVYGKITSKASGTSITFTPDLGPSVATTGTIASGAQVIPASAQGATGATGSTGGNGSNGASPLTLTTASYTSSTSAVAIAVTPSSTGAFAVGQYATVTNAAGTARTSGTITAVASGSITFQAFATTPPGDAVTGTVYAIGSTVAVSGAQGATGATGGTGPAGSAFTSGFRAWQSAGQSISATTYTKLQFNTKVWDGLTEYDATTNYRFTAQSAGKYTVTTVANSTTATIGQRMILTLYKNGVEHSRLNDITLSATSSGMINGAVELDMAAFDYIEVYLYSSLAITMQAGSAVQYFSALRTQ